MERPDVGQRVRREGERERERERERGREREREGERHRERVLPRMQQLCLARQTDHLYRMNINNTKTSLRDISCFPAAWVWSTVTTQSIPRTLPMDLEGKALRIKVGIQVWVLLRCNVLQYLDVCDKEGLFTSGEAGQENTNEGLMEW